MRREPVSEESIAEARIRSRDQPATGLPELARPLLAFGWRIDRARPSEGLPYFEEAAAIYRGLLADGSDEHLGPATHAIHALGRWYSLAHADDRSLAAKEEAASLARQLNRHREDTRKETRILGASAHGLAEAGQFAQAVTAQREVVDIYRAAEDSRDVSWPSGVVWSLLDLAIYLDLAGQTDESLEIEREALRIKRRTTEDEPRGLSGLVIWLAGVSPRFSETGHPREAEALLDEAVVVCDRLPPVGDCNNFGFDQGVQAALFARSGTRDERPVVGGAFPIGVSPDLRALQPVHGVSFDWWAHSVRQTYRVGGKAIDDAIATTGDRSALDPAGSAELGTLLRRRNIRRSVTFDHLSQHFIEQVIPALGESVDLERRLASARPEDGPRRLIRSLTDQAVGHLVAGSYSVAGDTLREARDLCATTEGRDALPLVEAEAGKQVPRSPREGAE
ncbi:tetratricopeptide repeat protein [Streptomyces sp. NPDC005794]|uniref:tetratricopeptide repeat protein n=1 Tax=Streptomyces sp. NPDC005794 TaxID=3364733 RepID=UPI0036C9CF4C